MTRAEFLEKCSQRWDDIENLQHFNNLYDLEKTFDGIWTETGRDILESSIGKVPENHRKKKSSKQNTEKLKLTIASQLLAHRQVLRYLHIYKRSLYS